MDSHLLPGLQRRVYIEFFEVILNALSSNIYSTPRCNVAADIPGKEWKSSAAAEKTEECFTSLLSDGTDPLKTYFLNVFFAGRYCRIRACNWYSNVSVTNMRPDNVSCWDITTIRLQSAAGPCRSGLEGSVPASHYAVVHQIKATGELPSSSPPQSTHSVRGRSK